MHPVLITVPGAVFKLLAPALIVWGLYSLVVAYNRRALATQKAGTAKSDAPPERRLLPADSPANAIISIVIGVGLFVFAANLEIPHGNLAARLVGAMRAFLSAVISRRAWAAPWQALPIYSYGVMLGTSLLVGWFVTLRYAERQGLPRDRMIDCYLFTAFTAVLGSRVLYVVTNLHEFVDPETHRFVFASMFALRTGGLVAYGGFLGGLAGSAIYLRRHDLSLWKWADAAVPSLASGLAITRVGCYLYGCDFGKPLARTAPGWLRHIGTFPRWPDDRGSPAWIQHHTQGLRVDAATCLERLHGDVHDGLCFLANDAHASAPVHPTQLYESLTGAAIFVVLVWLWKRHKFEGQIFLAFGVLYGLARSALEILRDDHERGIFAGLSTSQWIGLASAIACAAIYFVRKKSAPKAEPVDLFAKAVVTE